MEDGFEARGEPSGCAVGGCDGHPYGRSGLCEMHYRRRLRTGDVRAEVPKHGTAPAKPCSVASCSQPSEARGWCHGHYLRWRRDGDVNADEALTRCKQPETCTVEGCANDTSAHGLCKTHLVRRDKHGDVQADVPIRTQRKPPPRDVCLAGHCQQAAVTMGLCESHCQQQSQHGDVLTLETVRMHTGAGSIHHGYRNVTVPPGLRDLTNGVSWIGEHRLMMAIRLGRALYPDEVVHHINGDRTDNRFENLELWSSGHPKGQRIADKVRWAQEVLRRYRPELLTGVSTTLCD